jgi:hypothetical protein
MIKNNPSTSQIFWPMLFIFVLASMVLNSYFGDNPPIWYDSTFGGSWSIVIILIAAKCFSFLMSEDKKQAADNGVAISAVLISAIGLNLGLTAQAGDAPSYQLRWLAGLLMVVIGGWLYFENKRYLDLGSQSVSKSRKEGKP